MCVCLRDGSVADMVYGVRTEPSWKFVWNFHMLNDVRSLLHSDWLLYIIHGFIGQSSILSSTLSIIEYEIEEET